MVLKTESLVVVRADEIEPLIEVATKDRILRERLGEYAAEKIVCCMGIYQGKQEDLTRGLVEILGGIVLVRDGYEDLRAEEIFVTEAVDIKDPGLVGSVEEPLVEASKRVVGLMFRSLKIRRQELGESDREMLENIFSNDPDNPGDLVWDDNGWPSKAQTEIQVVVIDK